MRRNYVFGWMISAHMNGPWLTGGPNVVPSCTYRRHKRFQEILAQQRQGHGSGEELDVWSSLYDEQCYILYLEAKAVNTPRV